MAVTKIDPFEFHPEVPSIKYSTKSNKITIGQLDSVIADITVRMYDSPDKTWGYSKNEMELWLRMVINEAEKISTSQSFQSD